VVVVVVVVVLMLTCCEQTLSETDRCRALFELAVNQPLLDMPETLWKAYIGAYLCARRTRANER
jgi:hypothetical protein